MLFVTDYSETLEVFFLTPTDGISDHLYVSQSVREVLSLIIVLHEQNIE
jgi:hypothetical protein